MREACENWILPRFWSHGDGNTGVKDDLLNVPRANPVGYATYILFTLDFLLAFIFETDLERTKMTLAPASCHKRGLVLAGSRAIFPL